MSIITIIFYAVFISTSEKTGISFLDISTGEFFIAEGDKEYADKLLQSLKPAEVIFQRSQQKYFKEFFGNKFFTYSLDEWIFAEAYAKESLLKHFGTHSLKVLALKIYPQVLLQPVPYFII